MKVYLQYFRESGKWYMDDEYETSVKDLMDIWDEVRERNLGTEFNILVNVPDHEHAHPKMVMIGHAPKPYVRLNSYEV